MTKTCVHGFYDTAGKLFVGALNKSDRFQVSCWIGHSEVGQRDPLFDYEILDFHCGKFPELSGSIRGHTVQKIIENKEKIMRGMLRHTMLSRQPDLFVESLILRVACFF